VSEDHTRGHGFDELARSLAEGSISRRRALKLFAGTALAALIPSRAMAAVTCPPDKVKICHIPQRADGTCRRGAAETLCVTPAELATHAGHPCDCCRGCGGTDQCRENRTRTCFPTTTAPPTTAPPTTAPPTTAPPTTAPPVCSPTGGDGPFCGRCGPNGTCFCVQSTEGRTVCVQNFGIEGGSCTSSAECQGSTRLNNPNAQCLIACSGAKFCVVPTSCTA
jgi:hypothetical protein